MFFPGRVLRRTSHATARTRTKLTTVPTDHYTSYGSNNVINTSGHRRTHDQATQENQNGS
jgi:hypothetical protein